MTLTTEGIPTDSRSLRSIKLDLRRVSPHVPAGGFQTAASNLQAFIPDAKSLGGGADRAGWKIGDYVVKRQSSWGNKWATTAQRRIMRDIGLKRSPQWLVNGWVVQPFYLMLPTYPRSESQKYDGLQERLFEHNRQHPKRTVDIDFHSGNIGAAPDGSVVMFDW